jgi:hypothetical protein
MLFISRTLVHGEQSCSHPACASKANPPPIHDHQGSNLQKARETGKFPNPLTSDHRLLSPFGQLARPKQSQEYSLTRLSLLSYPLVPVKLLPRECQQLLEPPPVLEYRPHYSYSSSRTVFTDPRIHGSTVSKH